MVKKMLIDASQHEETRMAIIHDEKLIEYESEVIKFKPIKGNIYLAKIIRVEPSLQAAFVDYGAQRHGFLAYNEIHPDYFKIPTSDKEKILAEENISSSNYTIDENDEDFNENDSNITDLSESEGKSLPNKRSFLDKVFDFFNYAPIEDEDVIKKESYKKLKPRRPRNQNNKRPSIHKKYSIQEVIKRNQVILIQAVREERGNKGAAVTTRLSLAGRYCVLMPNTNKGGGVSRKIFDINLRKKLKDILSSLNIKSGMGVIIRTAGQSMKKTDISRDYKALLKLWSQITSKTIKSTAPSLIHEEGNLLKRSIRDYFSSDLNKVIVNNKRSFKTAKDIMKFFMPGFTKFITLEDDSTKSSLFSSEKIETQINQIHKPVVKLKSGGYLVINQTEALVAIDINSGKYTKQRNIEDTALRTNLEAAEEIAIQIRLRDLAGLIVIDFIDMLEKSNNFKVEKRMKESIKNDRAKIQCGRISNFGLMELSRQRLKQVINSATSHKCNICNGIGLVTSVDFTAMQTLRVCEEIIINQKYKSLIILVNKTVADLINHGKKDHFSDLLKRCKIDIQIRDFYDFSISDSMIFHEGEIVYRNCDSETKLTNALNHIENNVMVNKKIVNNKGKKLLERNEKIKTDNKDTKYKSEITNTAEPNTKKVHQKVNSGSNKEIIKPKNKQVKKIRSSFREKAVTFNKSETKKRDRTDKLIKVNKKNSKDKKTTKKIIEGKKKHEVTNESKREGWWSQ